MTGSRTVDLNADMGEAVEPDGIAVERALLEYVTSVHVACGGHAGDAASMRATVEAALAADVGVGAHPSYPDRAGFGRRPMELAWPVLLDSLRMQVSDLSAVARAAGTEVQSVKAHGALYGEVARGGAACVALISVLHDLCHASTPLVLPAGAPALALAKEIGRPTLEEGFCDRAYRPDGTLVDRTVPGAVFDEPERAAEQAGTLARGLVRDDVGTWLSLHPDTLCLHGDSPNALSMAMAVRDLLEREGVVVAAAAR
ncbi:MAG TPA: 5-oxoprolinase subunit PxpA [Acidimicrobiales bacterium]|jgi:UPF0271 protein|nr:5-oxoprolinase subunit PxpA [Acidimicrobiales bacterium]